MRGEKRKLLTPAEVRKATKSNYRVTGYVYQRGRMYVDLVTPTGYPRTREVKI